MPEDTLWAWCPNEICMDRRDHFYDKKASGWRCKFCGEINPIAISIPRKAITDVAERYLEEENNEESSEEGSGRPAKVPKTEESG